MVAFHSRSRPSVPICGNPLTSATEELSDLQNSLKEIERTAGEFTSVPAALDREFERVKSGIRIVSEKLRGIRTRMQALEGRSEEAKRPQYDSLRVSRFMGNLE